MLDPAGPDPNPDLTGEPAVFEVLGARLAAAYLRSEAKAARARAREQRERARELRRCLRGDG